MTRVLAVLGLAVLAAGCTGSTSSSVPPASATSSTAAPARTATLVLEEGVTVQAPTDWFETPFRGSPGTVVFPLVFLSTEAFSGPCASGKLQESCSDKGWFPADWVAPTDGLLVLWKETEFPGGPGLEQLDGQLATIDGHPAKIWSGKATTSCPTEASTEMDAFVSDESRGNPGVRWDMTACLGARPSDRDRAAVQTMLDSLHITG
jgi:hypothetical protein